MIACTTHPNVSTLLPPRHCFFFPFRFPILISSYFYYWPHERINSAHTKYEFEIFLSPPHFKRKSLEQELLILTRVKHDCIISATAIVREDSNGTGSEVPPMPTMYIELPYAAGGDLR